MHRLICWLCCWVDLFATIIRLASFHLIDPPWDLDFRCWVLTKQSEARKLRREVERESIIYEKKYWIWNQGYNWNEWE